MTIEKIHEHSVCTSLLPDGANILDIGCRGFLFTDYFRAKGHIVFAIDPDELGRDDYIRCAISDFDGFVGVKVNSNDPQSTTIYKKLIYDIAFDIRCYTIESFSNLVWHLIKIDAEGSEYEIIMSLKKAPAKQLSIEFHLHTGVYGMYEMTLMQDKLKALGYTAVQHEMTSEHGAGENYWNSLFILK
jgi:hypothetical protein